MLAPYKNTLYYFNTIYYVLFIYLVYICIRNSKTMSKIQTRVTTAINSLNKLKSKLAGNGYLSLEDVLQLDHIESVFLKYNSEHHYQKCIDNKDHDTAKLLVVKIDTDEFEYFIESKELNKDVFDYVDSDGHGQMVSDIELSECLTEDNLKAYITSGGTFSIESE